MFSGRRVCQRWSRWWYNYHCRYRRHQARRLIWTHNPTGWRVPVDRSLDKLQAFCLDHDCKWLIALITTEYLVISCFGNSWKPQKSTRDRATWVREIAHCQPCTEFPPLRSLWRLLSGASYSSATNHRGSLSHTISCTWYYDGWYHWMIVIARLFVLTMHISLAGWRLWLLSALIKHANR